MIGAGKTKKGAGKLKISAGILAYTVTATGVKVLLGHPGGPFWKNKDQGSWTILKGEPNPGEDFFASALREFFEETGWELPAGHAEPLTPVKQKAGKWIYAWAIDAFRPAEDLLSNEFETEWPPHSGSRKSFLEIDRFAWLTIDAAKEKINPAQQALLEELKIKLAGS